MTEYAFPNPALCDENYRPMPGDYGMTLRDWFAGQFMAASISKGSEKIEYGFFGDAAYYAYKAADAMLEARK